MIDELIAALVGPGEATLDVQKPRVIETHISWVVLTGDYAYKIKKPVDFGFLDFTTLKRRYYFCSEELRLNQRMASELYLDLVAIKEVSGKRVTARLEPATSLDTASLPDDVLEVALRMVQFNPEAVLSNVRNKPELRPMLMQLIGEFADFHQNRCSICQLDQPWGHAESILQTVLENFEHIHPFCSEKELRVALLEIKEWSLHQHQGLRTVMEARRRDGFVRECHGDLHLGNIAEIRNKAVAFDCIEFNEALRWIDVINDLAFLVMDMESHGNRSLAYPLMNRYLEITGDYRGAALLPYYRVYRAMVRAKIAALSLENDSKGPNVAQDALHDYLALALDISRRSQPLLVLTHGVSGSGKSTFAQQLSAHAPFIHIRSDVERKRLADHHKSPADALYSAEMTLLTYSHLLQLTEHLISAGSAVIVDATFLKESQRRPFIELASRSRVPLRIVHCIVSSETAKVRLEWRQEQASDPSDADFRIMQSQVAEAESLTPEECRSVISVNSESPTCCEAAIAEILRQIEPDPVQRG